MNLPETARLDYRTVDPQSDLMEIFRMQSDPEVMRYIRAPVREIEAVVERIGLWTDYQSKHPGLGVWMALWKENNEIAGHCLLREAEWKAGGDLEIGYVLHKKYWGKGLATEMADGLCRYAFEHFPVDSIIAFIDPENQASRRVLEKCGFEPEGLVPAFEGISLRLRLLKASYQR
ncbi:MAG: GNAT family N-acetyltransferase [Saprospiraceae bacterium]